MKVETLNPEQKADAAEIAAVLQGVPMSAQLMCSLMTSTLVYGFGRGYDLGVKEGVRRAAGGGRDEVGGGGTYADRGGDVPPLAARPAGN